MENYDRIEKIGEGTYGSVYKCFIKGTKQPVAIKRFKDAEDYDEAQVMKTAMREIVLLRSVNHTHIVTLLDVFRYKHKLCLVFDYVEYTVLKLIENSPSGLIESTVQSLIWQLLQAIDCLHSHGIMHRDIKPENLLVSNKGILKICDFGFARRLSEDPVTGGKYSDYVATRWYRAPELLLPSQPYDASVDIWALGCLVVEMLTGRAMMPGSTDIDQLSLITHCVGPIPGITIVSDDEDSHDDQDNDQNYQNNHNNDGGGYNDYDGDEKKKKNSDYNTTNDTTDTNNKITDLAPLKMRYGHLSSNALSFIENCLQIDPNNRPSAQQLLKHSWMTHNSSEWKTNEFLSHLEQAKKELRERQQLVLQRNSLNTVGSHTPSYTHVLHNSNTPSAHAHTTTTTTTTSGSRKTSYSHDDSSVKHRYTDVRRESVHSTSNTNSRHAIARHAITSYGNNNNTSTRDDNNKSSTAKTALQDTTRPSTHSNNNATTVTMNQSPTPPSSQSLEQKKAVLSSPYLSKPSSIKSPTHGKRSIQNRSRSSSPSTITRTTQTPQKSSRLVTASSPHMAARRTTQQSSPSPRVLSTHHHQNHNEQQQPEAHESHDVHAAVDDSKKKGDNESVLTRKGRSLLRRILPRRAHRD